MSSLFWTNTPLRHCTVERQGATLIVTIARPEVLNSLHEAADFELDAVWSNFEADAELRVAILTGSGDRAFCAGNDLKALAGSAGPRRFPESGFGGLTLRTGRRKPVIAAVRGAAMGGGFELCLSCDLVIASTTARFALPEPLVGRCALMGGVQYLARSVGFARAMGILLTGRTIEAAEAFDLGLVTEVVDGDVLEAASGWARKILRCSPAAIAATRRLARYAAFDTQFESALKSAGELEEVQALRNSDDFREGALAFAERRPPVWKI